MKHPEEHYVLLHEYAKTKLKNHLRALSDEIDEMHYRISRLRHEIHVVTTAAKDEEWWNLRHLLSTEEVDDLCDVSPKDLLADDE